MTEPVIVAAAPSPIGRPFKGVPGRVAPRRSWGRDRGGRPGEGARGRPSQVEDLMLCLGGHTNDPFGVLQKA
jgi:hypothetical protein